MDHSCECSACNATTEARPPNRAFWALIAGFWLTSVALGFGAVRNGWSFVLFSSWVALATSVVLLARRATSWTCAACGSSVPPPVRAAVEPITGALREARPRHA
ncbi:hypothetical protein BH11MYX4_BH11MYX4_69530 [soil metagenome]